MLRPHRHPVARLRRALRHAGVARRNAEERAERADADLLREQERRKADARRSLLAAMLTDLASGFVNAPIDTVDSAIRARPAA